MAYTKFDFKSSDNVKVQVLRWLPQKDMEIRAVLQIAHGMAEHAARYDAFLTGLAAKGIACYANDHRGHGRTAESDEDIGFFSDNNGWDKVVSDMHTLTCNIQDAHPEVPVFILGHSMGSILLKSYICRHGEKIAGAVFSGTAGDPGILGKIAGWIAAAQVMFQGKKSRSHLLNNMMFGGFNKQFKPNRTEFDWLSRDHKTVDDYIADPLCGNVFTASFFADFFYGIREAGLAKNINNIPKHLPLYFFSGSEDPVGGREAEGVCREHDRYKTAGIRDVGLKIYSGGRHEMLNETNKDEVISDLFAWLNQRIR